uniref:BED-type domain-containing protein n=1 Tax=Parastrongyloides trichosuri TaxID=131310 RepID=A0A0N4ZTX9_PARTI
MKSDTLGLTRLLGESHRACTYCGTKYKISTSCYTIFRHCIKHESFHPILMRHLGKRVFQKYLRYLPTEYVDKPPISPSFEARISSNINAMFEEEEKSGELVGTERMCKIFENEEKKSKEKKCLDNDLIKLSNMIKEISDKDDKNGGEELNKMDALKKELSDADSDDPLRDPIIEEIMRNSNKLPNGFRKRLKSDNLKLTKLVSIRHRICLSCNRKFMSSCGVTSLYKHCAKHPEFREILKKNLTPTALNNALKGLKTRNKRRNHYYNRDRDDDIFMDNTDTDNNSINVTKNKSIEIIEKNIDELASIKSINLDQFDKKGITNDKDESNEKPEECSIVIKNEKDSITKMESLLDICIQFSKDEGIPIEKFDNKYFQNLLKYDRKPYEVPIINSRILYNQKYIDLIHQRISQLKWDERYDKVSISISNVDINKKLISVLKLHFINQEMETKTMIIGFIEYNYFDINFDYMKRRVEAMLNVYDLDVKNISAIVTDNSEMAKYLGEVWNVPLITCLKKEIDNVIRWCECDCPEPLSILIIKGVKLFSIYKALIPKYIQSAKFFSIPLGNIYCYPINWLSAYNLIQESIVKIEEINLFASSYVPTLKLTKIEMTILQNLASLLEVFGMIATKLSDKNIGLYNYIPIVYDLYNNITLFHLDRSSKINNNNNINKLTKDIDIFLEDKEWFEIPSLYIDTGITQSNNETILKEYISCIQQRVIKLKDKVYNNDLLVASLYLNSRETFRTKYGNEVFWANVGSKLDPCMYEEINDKMVCKLESGSCIEKYHNITTDNNNESVNEFWKKNRNHFEKLNKSVLSIFCIPSFILPIKNLEENVEFFSDEIIDEENSNILVCKCLNF